MLFVRPTAALNRRLRSSLPVAVAAALALLPLTGQLPTEAAEPGREIAAERLAGSQRYATARVIAGSTFGSVPEVVIAKAENWPDALAGNYLAGTLESPILLVSQKEVQEDTLAALAEMEAERVVVLGGEDAVSADSVAVLEDTGYAVERVAGASRFETAAAIALAGAKGGAEALGAWDGQRTAVVATGAGFADALVSGAVSWSERFPLLLTTSAELHPAAAAALEGLGIERVIIPGGTGAVSEAVADEIEAKGIAVTRVAGGDRWETAVELGQFAIDELGYGADHANVATGFAFADALVMGPHAGAERRPLLLTPGSHDAPTGALLGWLQTKVCETRSLHIAGGVTAVSHANVAALAAALSGCEPSGNEDPADAPGVEPPDEDSPSSDDPGTDVPKDGAPDSDVPDSGSPDEGSDPDTDEGNGSDEPQVAPLGQYETTVESFTDAHVDATVVSSTTGPSAGDIFRFPYGPDDVYYHKDARVTAEQFQAALVHGMHLRVHKVEQGTVFWLEWD